MSAAAIYMGWALADRQRRLGAKQLAANRAASIAAGVQRYERKFQQLPSIVLTKQPDDAGDVLGVPITVAAWVPDGVIYIGPIPAEEGNP